MAAPLMQILTFETAEDNGPNSHILLPSVTVQSDINEMYFEQLKTKVQCIRHSDFYVKMFLIAFINVLFNSLHERFSMHLMIPLPNFRSAQYATYVWKLRRLNNIRILTKKCLSLIKYVIILRLRCEALYNDQTIRQDATFEPRHDKTNKVTVRRAKTQISLGIRPVWSESSLYAQWVAKDPSFLHADSEDSDQTGWMTRLIWVFAGRRLILLVLSCRGSFGFDAFICGLLLWCIPNSFS